MLIHPASELSDIGTLTTRRDCHEIDFIRLSPISAALTNAIHHMIKATR
jgi:hypothetical protein